MRKRTFLTGKWIVTAMIFIAASLAVTAPTFAWFSQKFRFSKTEKLEIDMPPIIYLKDDNLQEMTSFHLDGLKIGVEYNAVFCVSPAIYNSVNSFSLGLIFTQNMGMDINIYPIFSVTEENAVAGAENEKVDITRGETTTACYFNYYKQNDREFADEVFNGYTYKKTYGGWTSEKEPEPGNLNGGVFKSYDGLKFSEKTESSSTLIGELNDTSRYRFFVLNITWPDGAGIENAKEADIVYIVSKGTRG